MSKQYLGRDFSSADGADTDKITPGMLNTLAEVRYSAADSAFGGAATAMHKAASKAGQGGEGRGGGIELF